MGWIFETFSLPKNGDECSSVTVNEILEDMLSKGDSVAVTGQMVELTDGELIQKDGRRVIGLKLVRQPGVVG